MIKISASFLLAKLYELRHGFECQEYLIAQMIPSTYHFIKRERYLILIYNFHTRWTVQLNPVCCFLSQNRPLRVVWLNNLDRHYIKCMQKIRTRVAFIYKIFSFNFIQRQDHKNIQRSIKILFNGFQERTAFQFFWLY